MKIHHLLFLFSFLILSCGSTKTITDRSEIKKETPKKILKNHTKNTFNENTLSADLKVNFNKSGKSQSMNIKLRLEKDNMIWVSATVFGFPVAKAIITPERVSYYVKINKTYFDGDFSKINTLLGAELDFTMLQNLLLGDALFDMNPKNYESSIDREAHLLTPKESNELAALLFWIHPINYKIEQQEIRTFESDKFLAIKYSDYQNIEKTTVPGSVEIIAKDNRNNVTIRLDYKSVKINETLSFPYKIPSGYKRILN